MPFPKIVFAKPITQYQINLRYADGTEGTADLSYLAGRGIFKNWDESDLFFQVKIDPETNVLVWNDMLDLDPDSLYLQIRGLSFEQFKAQSSQPFNAAD